ARLLGGSVAPVTAPVPPRASGALTAGGEGGKACEAGPPDGVRPLASGNVADASGGGVSVTTTADGAVAIRGRSIVTPTTIRTTSAATPASNALRCEGGAGRGDAATGCRLSASCWSAEPGARQVVVAPIRRPSAVSSGPIGRGPRVTGSTARCRSRLATRNPDAVTVAPSIASASIATMPRKT